MKNILDSTTDNDINLQEASSKVDKALESMRGIELDEKQRLIVDDAISASNFYGVMYAHCAYRLGLQDGIKLMSELKEIENQQ